MIELLKAHEAALVVGLYSIGMAGGLACIMSVVYVAQGPTTEEQYSQARRVANIGITVMAVIVPVVTGVLCYALA
jgi:hypothetical protein